MLPLAKVRPHVKQNEGESSGLESSLNGLNSPCLKREPIPSTTSSCVLLQVDPDVRSLAAKRISSIRLPLLLTSMKGFCEFLGG